MNLYKLLLFHGLMVLTFVLQSCEESRSIPQFSDTVITVTETGGSNPTVAIDGQSATYVVWVGETSENRFDVYLQKFDKSGRPLKNPVTVNDIPGDAAPHTMAPAKVVVNNAGDVFVVWQNNTNVEGRRFPASDLRFARSTDGGERFEDAIFVNDDAGKILAGHTFQDMTVSENGIIYVSWIDSRNKAMMKHGAAGHGNNGPKSEIRVARSFDNGLSFEPSVVVDTTACPCCKTTIVCAENGDVFIAWRREYPGSIRDIAIAKSTNNGLSFSDPVRVHNDGWYIDGCPHNGPSLAIAEDGNVYVSWFTGSEAITGSYVAVSENGGESFGQPIPIAAEKDISAYRSIIVSDRPERLFIATESQINGQSQIHFLVQSVHESANNVPVASTLLSSGILPAMAFASSKIAIAWQQDQSVRLQISDIN
ncbi:MAG: exo-alpha-sialidase [Calditrichae bacterium]|nr:exo-alpha-sialidase [Calditrichia bacterium]